MARPPKQRCVHCKPVSVYFKPIGVALAPDELEALRLADLDGLYQADVALQMGVSRQTVGNILERAHRKVADALIHGKALRIDAPAETSTTKETP